MIITSLISLILILIHGEPKKSLRGFFMHHHIDVNIWETACEKKHLYERKEKKARSTQNYFVWSFWVKNVECRRHLNLTLKLSIKFNFLIFLNFYYFMLNHSKIFLIIFNEGF